MRPTPSGPLGSGWPVTLPRRPRRRYLAVDPDNRLVAQTLEADWNLSLRELAEAHDDYDRARAAGSAPLGDEQQARVRALAADPPALWADPALCP